MRDCALGFGTHLTKGNLETLVPHAINAGFSLVDTAPNYGGGHNQAAVGRANASVPISTKVGFLSARQRLRLGENAVEGHLLSPEYIRHQVAINIEELRREPLDLLFLHNPEVQLKRTDPVGFRDLIAECFAECERLHGDGKLQSYGISSWRGCFEVLSVDALWKLAFVAGGLNHHFAAIQLPVSLVRIEEVVSAWRGKKEAILQQARDAGVRVFASSPLHGGQLPSLIDNDFVNLMGHGLSAAQACIQFVRSTQLVDVILIGCSTITHIEEMAAVLSLEPIEAAQINSIINLLS